jgi:hypothetical protein
MEDSEICFAYYGILLPENLFSLESSFVSFLTS